MGFMGVNSKGNRLREKKPVQTASVEKKKEIPV